MTPHFTPAIELIQTDASYAEDVETATGEVHVHLIGDMLIGASLNRGDTHELLATRHATGVQVTNTPEGLAVQIPAEGGGLCASTTVGAVFVHNYGLVLSDSAVEVQEDGSR